MTDDAQEAQTDENGEGEEDAPKKSKLKLIIIGAGALVVLLGGGAAAYFLLFSGSSEDSAGTVAVAPVQTYFYDLPEMTVNLANTGENEQFLKLTVALELANEEELLALEPRITLILDAFQVYLRELRRSDLEGSAGIYRLKDELRRRVNLAIYPAQIQSILFKEILVQ